MITAYFTEKCKERSQLGFDLVVYRHTVILFF